MFQLGRLQKCGFLFSTVQTKRKLRNPMKTYSLCHHKKPYETLQFVQPWKKATTMLRRQTPKEAVTPPKSNGDVPLLSSLDPKTNTNEVVLPCVRYGEFSRQDVLALMINVGEEAATLRTKLWVGGTPITGHRASITHEYDRKRESFWGFVW